MRSQSVPVTLDEVSALESSRALEVPTQAAQGSPAWCFPLGPSRAVGWARRCPMGPSWAPEDMEVLGEGLQRAGEPPASAPPLPPPPGVWSPHHCHGLASLLVLTLSLSLPPCLPQANSGS